MDNFTKEDIEWMNKLATESVMDMVQVLRVHKREDLIQDEKMRDLLSDVYRAGMIKVLEFARKKP